MSNKISRLLKQNYWSLHSKFIVFCVKIYEVDCREKWSLLPLKIGKVFASFFVNINHKYSMKDQHLNKVEW
jgi:hypothetical protein